MKSDRLVLMIVFVAWLLAATVTSYASMEMDKQVNIDLTNQVDAEAKATWSDPDKIAVSKAGLGWDGDAAGRDGWIQTKPIALGLSWRPTDSIYARVTIQPLPQEFTMSNGQKSTPGAGAVYVRYSPDLKNWSSWQVLQRAQPQSFEEKKNPGRLYSGMIRVPYRDQEQYRKLILEYSRMDVPWKSDEEAAVKWIVDRDPDFFAKHIPFIGYAQFMFEGQFFGGQRIQSFKAQISYGMGGIHSPPKDESVYQKRDVPWRYEAGKDATAATKPGESDTARQPNR